MATATEGYVDVRAEEVRAGTQLDLERIMGRRIRWTIMAIFAAAGLTIGAVTLAVSLLVS